MSSKIITLAQLTTFLTKLKAKLATVALSGSYNDLKDKPTTIANANVAAKTVTTAPVDGTADVFRATMASNDAARIRVGGASNAGWMEIATGDDASEPIYVRQYQCGGSGTGDDAFFKTLVRTATLLDGSGNTVFPGTVTANGFTGNVSGNASTATKLAAARTVQTNLASTAAASFDGSANIAPGVTGTLPAANGGTGQTSLDKVTVGAAKAVPWTGVTDRPTKVSAFTNDAGYLTTHQSLAAYAKTTDVNTALAKKQDTLTFDTAPTSGSTNPVTSGGVYDAIEHLPCILVEDNSTQTLTPLDFQSAVWSSTQPTSSCTVWIEEK